MAKMDPMEKLAREICWASFSQPRHRIAQGKTKAEYWKSLPESARQNYRAEARQFAYLHARINIDVLNEVACP